MRIANATLLAITTLLALTTPLALAPTAGATEWAEKMFAQTRHNFGNVGRGTTAEFRFEFENVYQEPLHVASIRSSCGCTDAAVTKDSLVAHESAAVVAKFNTTSFVGQKAATITIVFDQPYYAEVQLQVAGHVNTDITFDPPEIDFGEVKSGAEPVRQIRITHRGNPAWRITDVRSHCQDLSVSLSPPKNVAGGVTYDMAVKMKPSMPEGDLKNRLTLISNDREFPTVEMAIEGMIRPSLVMTPAAVSLGSTEAGQSVQKRLLVRGEEAFEITEVRCPDDRFEFKVPPGSKKIHLIPMTFTADARAGAVSQKIEVVTAPGDRIVGSVATGMVR